MSNLEIWRLRAEIRELKEIQKMLLKNMFHYEYRARDAIIEIMKAEDEAQRLRDKYESSTSASLEEKEKGDDN